MKLKLQTLNLQALRVQIDKIDESKVFHYALVGSLCAHALTLLLLFVFRSVGLIKPFKPFEVTYKIVEEQYGTKADPNNPNKSIQADRPREAVKKNLNKISLPNSFVNDNRKIENSDVIASQKQPTLLDTAYDRPKVSIPVFKAEKMTNPQYLSYENAIRTKIRNRAYFLLDELMTEADLEPGEVYLTFLITSDGVLKEIQIIEEKTQANDFLRKVSLMSVKEASPFPPMPDNKYPEITYNITISYEVNKGR